MKKIAFFLITSPIVCQSALLSGCLSSLSLFQIHFLEFCQFLAFRVDFQGPDLPQKNRPTSRLTPPLRTVIYAPKFISQNS